MFIMLAALSFLVRPLFGSFFRGNWQWSLLVCLAASLLGLSISFVVGFLFETLIDCSYFTSFSTSQKEYAFLVCLGRLGWCCAILFYYELLS